MSKRPLPPPAHDIGVNERNVIKGIWRGAPMAGLDPLNESWLAAHTWGCAEPAYCDFCAKWRGLKKVSKARIEDSHSSMTSLPDHIEDRQDAPTRII